MKVWKDYHEENKDRFLSELLDLLSIPSVSTQKQHEQDMIICANAVKQRLLEAGCDKAEIYETGGHPIVCAEKMIDDTKPTVLVYGHYDVQPGEPFELWNSHPFKPLVKDGNVFARGASDDKGQFYTHVKALEIMNRTNTMATNIKFMIEGEEETGSANLEKFIKEKRELLKADIILISDNAMLSAETPSLETGFRGISMIELEVTGPDKDLHSGAYGGAVANPIIVNSKIAKYQ